MARKAYELLALAHEYYQSPLEHQDWTGRNRLPDEDITSILETLNESGKNPELLNDISRALGTTSDKLRYAALFFIKRLLFSGSRNFYQVLGVPKETTPALIKKQYRLLIGLFHPDKNPDGEQWHKDYAPLINEAYNTLKRPHSRAAYDRRLKASSTRTAAKPTTAGKPIVPSDKNNRFMGWIRQLPRLLFEIPLLYRSPKLTIWTITVFTIIAFLIYSHFHSDVDFLQTTKDEQALTKTQNQNSSAPASPKKSLELSDQDNKVLDRTLASENLEKLLEDDRNFDSFTKIQPKVSLDLIGYPAPAPGKDKNQTKDRASPAGHVAGTTQTDPEDVSDTTARALFLRYVKSYETGDLKQLLNICSPDIITNQGQGRAIAEATYRQLFENSQRREFIVKGISVKPLSRSVTDIRSDIEIVVLPKNETVSQRYVGQILLRIVHDREQSRIVQLLKNLKRITDT
jgi:curved DNA-binding protein CbpA